MKAGPRAGLTLIEILIAVSLLSLLSLGMLWSMRIGFNTMEKTDNRLIHNRKVANSRKIIENELNGYLTTRAALHPEPLTTVTVPFLQAEPSVMRFVTTYSLEDASRGRMQLITLHVIARENNPGVRLVMEEILYTGPEQLGQLVTGMDRDPKTAALRLSFIEPAAGAGSFVLADQLAECHFSYLERLPAPPFQIWHLNWLDVYSLLRAVRIDMTPLAADSADLHVTSVTVALPVTKLQNRLYADD